MRLLALTFMALFLTACGGVIDNCPIGGLTPPPFGSSIPEPHPPHG